MDHATKEIAAIEKTVAEVAQAQINELNDLQLVLVGGGSADVVLA
jgi:hypothetical protein